MAFYKIKLSTKNITFIDDILTIAKLSEDDAADIIECCNDKVALECMGDITFKDIQGYPVKYSDVKDVIEINTHTSSLSNVVDMLLDIGIADNIHSEDSLREYCIHHINEGNKVAPLLQSIEDNFGCGYFGFDMSGYSNAEATPFYNIEDMLEYVL